MYFNAVHLKDRPGFVQLVGNIPSGMKQTIYPVSKLTNVSILDKDDSKLLVVRLIPNLSEDDEQVEYVARVIHTDFINPN